MIKISLFKLAILAILIFFSGYFVRSIHYRNDLPYLERGQKERRIDHERIKRDFMPLMKSAIKTVEGYEDIIDRNRAHPVIPFVEPEEEE